MRVQKIWIKVGLSYMQLFLSFEENWLEKCFEECNPFQNLDCPFEGRFFDTPT